MGYLLPLLFVLLLADILHSFSFFFFSALTLLVEQRKGIRPVKNWMLGCWRGYLPEARCRLAYGLADATATHCLCFSKIQIGPGSPRKMAIKWVCVLVCARAHACVRVCVSFFFFGDNGDATVIVSRVCSLRHLAKIFSQNMCGKTLDWKWTALSLGMLYSLQY